MKIIEPKVKQFDKNNSHNLTHIYWTREAKICYLSRDEWNELIAGLDKSLEVKNIPANRKTSRKYWHGGMWHYDDKQNEVYEARDGFEYYIYKCDEKPQVNDVETKLTGFEARGILVEKMNEDVGCKLMKAFGCISDPDWVEGIHRISRCLTQFIGVEHKFEGKKISGVYKADVSSAYPAQCSKKLPDAHTAKLVKGYVKPSEEYPVVFYLKSGHVAEYNMYDTHLDCLDTMYKEFRNPTGKKNKKGEPAVRFKMVEREDEMCLVMKYSNITLEKTFNYFYNRKSFDPDAKQILVATIGTFGYIDVDKKTGMIKKQNKYNYYGHIRAVVLARHNHQMIEYTNEIKRKGYEFVGVQTDSLMWRGGPLDSTVPKENKKLGDFVSEIENGTLYLHKCGSYCIADEKNTIIKHQGIKDWDESKIKTMDDFIYRMENVPIEYTAKEMNADLVYENKKIIPGGYML